MQSSLADLLDAWHDFDLLIGTAAATLVGLMFVAASIGASVFLEKDRAAMKAFISPTVVHFSAVLVVAAVPIKRSKSCQASRRSASEDCMGNLTIAGLSA